MIKKSYLCLVCLGAVSLLNAEVFTAKKPKISYSVSLDKPVNLEFNMKYSQPSTKPNPFSFSIYDEKGQRGRQFMRIFPDTTKPNGTKLNLPLKAGKYTLEMYSSGYHNKPFDLSMTKITGNFEQEPNDDFVEATPIKEKLYYTGYIQRKDGVKLYDYYKLNIAQNGLLTFTFEVDEKCNDKKGYEGYKIALFDGDLSKGRYKVNEPLYEIKNKDQKTKKTIGVPAGEYYARVQLETSSSFNKCDWNRAYRVAYITTPDQYVELEPNDKPEMATKIISGKYYQGQMEEKFSEADYFTFDVPVKQAVVIMFRHKDLKTRQSFNIKLKNEKNKHIDSFSSKGTETEKRFEAILEKGKYTLRVDDRIGNEIERKYSLGILLSKAEAKKQEVTKSKKSSNVEKDFLEKMKEQKKSIN